MSAPPGISYACVCTGTHKNAEAGTVPSSVTLKAFIDGTVQGPFANKEKASFNHDIFSYNFIKSPQGFTFIAIAPKDVETRFVYDFLGEMLREFEIGADRSTYESRLKVLLAKYSTPQDKIARATDDAEKAKEIMRLNLLKKVEAGEKLEVVEMQAANMENNADILQKKKHMMSNNVPNFDDIESMR